MEGRGLVEADAVDTEEGGGDAAHGWAGGEGEDGVGGGGGAAMHVEELEEGDRAVVFLAPRL